MNFFIQLVMGKYQRANTQNFTLNVTTEKVNSLAAIEMYYLTFRDDIIC